MKFILMMSATRDNWDSFAKWSKEDLERNAAFMRAFNQELRDSGTFVASEGLGWPNEARIVRARNDGEPITDGVFPESKEFLAGYLMVDVETTERAYEIAAIWSAGPGPGGLPLNMPIEVRQAMSVGASELP